MNALVTWLFLKFVLRFWRPLLVSIGALVSAALAHQTSPTENVLIFVGAFLASEAVFTVQRRRRRKLGLLSTPQRIGYWYRQRVSPGVEGDALDMRRASAPLFALSAFGVALDSIFVGLLLAPTSFGEKTPFFLEGRIILAVFAGGLLALCLVLLAIAVAAFCSASFARRWARMSHEPIGPFSSETNVLPLAAGLVFGMILAGALYAAAPAPSHAQVAAERQQQAAEKHAAAAERAAESVTRNVHALGTIAADGDFRFSLRRIRQVGTVPQEGGPPAGATHGDRLEVVQISVENLADRALPPFGATGFGALLVDGFGRRYKATDATFGLHDPLPDVKPHSTSLQTLVFQLPVGDPVNGVIVWDIFEPDDEDGATYVYFRAGAAPAVARLGPTAYGASSDH